MYTGFVPADDFEKIIRRHEFKSAYSSRYIDLGPVIQPFLKDERVAKELFERRNDALYASPANKVDDVAFEEDARVMIDYCGAWIERIRSQEEVALEDSTSEAVRFGVEGRGHSCPAPPA